MTHDLGCHGKVRLGDLPTDVRQKLVRLAGEWLEFDPASGDVLVRRVQPAAGGSLPVVAMELLQMLSLIPPANLERVPGGELFVDGEEHGQLARLRVAPGGVMHVEWAHPDSAWGEKRPYRGRDETSLEPTIHRLNGAVTLRARWPEAAARELQTLGDTFEGLYPEGMFRAAPAGAEGLVRLDMRDANVDAHLLLDRLNKVATAGTLEGAFTVGAFADELPEEHVRIVFERGSAFAQHPLLWSEASAH